MSVPSVIQLSCGCNEYPWGNQGSKSLAAQLCAKTPGWAGKGPPEKFKIDESTPYSEMWMGTYPVQPSYVLETGEDLQALIDKHPKELVGEAVIKKYGHEKIPFLPKVLSIAKALPLQLHPNKEIAAELHKKDPQNFTDPNHKPEIALALSKFEAFCGFKPLEDIQKLLAFESLKQFASAESAKQLDNNGLREVVRNMLKADDQTIKTAIKALDKLPASDFGKDEYIKELIPRLVEQYDDTDPGNLVALITMNFLVLQPNECISIPADGIHAYLSGDIIECMARSNNVLNVGMCPRAERNNVDLFCKCLTFTPHSAEECKLPGERSNYSKNGKTNVFRPPMNEFNILATELKPGDSETIAAIDGPLICIATRGDGTIEAKGKTYDAKEGSIWFVAQGTQLEIESKSGLLLHGAYADEGT